MNEIKLADPEGDFPKPLNFILIARSNDRRFLPESPGAELRIPSSFPAGTSFYDLEGSAIVLVPGVGYFSGYRGKLKGPLKGGMDEDGIPARLSRSGYDEDEAEWRRMAS